MSTEQPENINNQEMNQEDNSKEIIELKILTYNIYIRPPGISARGDDYKIERLEQFLKHEISKYDIICFEELFGALSSKRSQFLKEATKKGFEYYQFLERPGWPIYPVDGGVCIISKYPIIQTQQKVYTRGCYSDGLAAKGCLYCKIECGKYKYINIFGTHFQADYYETWEENEKSRTARDVQVEECMKFIHEISNQEENKNDPIIFLGDLNINGGTEDYTNFLKVVSKYNFKCIDCLKESTGEHPITHGEMDENGKKVDEVITSKDGGSGIRIDYILFLETDDDRKKLNYRNCKVEKFARKDEKLPCPFLSDHYGVESTIELN